MSGLKPTQEFRKDFETLGQILRKIHILQEKYWGDGRDLRGKPLPKISGSNRNSLVTSVGRPVMFQDLDYLIKSGVKGNLQLKVGNLLMPPLDLDKSFVPMLSLECDFGRSPPVMRLCVGMFSFNDRKPTVFAFRFETAHFNTNHDFCHGQFTREFERNSPSSGKSTKESRRVFASLPGWTPKHIPCVLIPARNPISLIISMLVSFYGVTIKSKMSDLNIGTENLEPFEFLQ